MSILYDILFLIAALCYLPYGISKGKLAGHISRRRGLLDKNLAEKFKNKEVIWLHAVSVGEILSCKVFLEHLKEYCPEYEILITTTTKTGNQIAKKLNLGEVAYMPLDLSFFVKRFVDRVNPQCVIFAETEIWPNVIHYLSSKNVKIVMVGGRISAGSFKRYKVIKFLLEPVLKKINFFFMQNETHSRRIITLGAKPEKVKTLGNLKFDSASSIGDDEDFQKKTQMLRERMQLKEEDLVLTAASTHESEEEVICDIFLKLKNECPGLKFIIAPRHIERSFGIEEILNKKAIEFSKFSENESCGNLLIDALGELKAVYSISDVVFVGGSLIMHGGQNVIEPAFFAKPIITGPYTFNFEDTVEALKAKGALIEIKNKHELLEKIRHLLKNKYHRLEIGRKAKEVVEANRGVSQRLAQEIKGILCKN